MFLQLAINGTPAGTRTQIDGLGNRCSIQLNYRSALVLRISMPDLICEAKRCWILKFFGFLRLFAFVFSELLDLTYQDGERRFSHSVTISLQFIKVSCVVACDFHHAHHVSVFFVSTQ